MFFEVKLYIPLMMHLSKLQENNYTIITIYNALLRKASTFVQGMCERYRVIFNLCLSVRIMLATTKKVFYEVTSTKTLVLR